MPHLERFLNIWKFIYLFVQDIESSVSSTFCAIFDSLKLCKVHYFGKRWFFSWNISSWCMPQRKGFFIIWQVFYPYVQSMKRSVSLIVLRYLRLSYALYGPFIWKKMIFFMKYFKLVHALTWKIPHYMKCILFICTRQETIWIFINFPLSATLKSLLRYILYLEKDDFQWNISSWCMHQLERFLIIWQVLYA